jgi:hypothetical protein
MLLSYALLRTWLPSTNGLEKRIPYLKTSYFSRKCTVKLIGAFLGLPRVAGKPGLLKEEGITPINEEIIRTTRA